MPIVILVLFDNEDNSYILEAPLAFCRSSYLLGGIIDVVGWGHCGLILAYAQVGRSESDDFVDDDDDDDKGLCLLPSLAFALPRVLTFSSNNTEILLRVCISVNVLHIKDISEKILYIKERNLTKKIRGSKGQGKCWTRSVV